MLGGAIVPKAPQFRRPCIMQLFYNYFIYFSEKEDNFAVDRTDAIKNSENIEDHQGMNHHKMGEVLEEVPCKPGPLSKKKLLRGKFRGKYFAKKSKNAINHKFFPKILPSNEFFGNDWSYYN